MRDRRIPCDIVEFVPPYVRNSMERQQRLMDILKVGDFLLPIIDSDSFIQAIGREKDCRNAEIQISSFPKAIELLVQDDSK